MSWSKQDTEAFRQIVSKAKECGVLQDLFEGQHMFPTDSPTSQFSLVSSAGESMTDAAKRRPSVEIDDLQRPHVPKGSDSMCTGYGNRKSKTSVEFSSTHDCLDSDDKIKLPSGVSNFETWSKTRIDFGKYEGQKMSYLHLARSQSPECIKYKNWCIQRNRSADGLLKDLSNFLVEYQRIENQKYGSAKSDGPFIPGTDHLRVLLD